MSIHGLAVRSSLPSRTKDFSSSHCVQTASGPLCAPNPMYTEAEARTGLGLVEQARFRPRPCLNNKNQPLNRTFRALSDNSFSTKKNLFVVALTLCSRQSRTTAKKKSDTNLIFSGIFVAAPSQKKFDMTPYKLGIRYLCTGPQTQK
jgi:hypothetical protein